MPDTLKRRSTKRASSKRASSTKRARPLRRLSEMPPAEEGWEEARLNRQSYEMKTPPPVDQWWNKYLFRKENLRVAVLCATRSSIRQKKWRSLLDRHYVDSAQLVYAGEAPTIPDLDPGRYVQYNRRLLGSFDVLISEYCPFNVERGDDSDILCLLKQRVLALGGHLILHTGMYERLVQMYALNDTKKELHFRQALVPDTWWYFTHRGRGGHAMSTHQAYLYTGSL
jgi:hypothetical protein